jgi:hypothetical protein
MKSLSLFAFAALLALHGNASAALVARYSFENDFSNAAGLSGPAGTPVNGATVGVAGGVVGNAMSLDTLAPNQHLNVALSFGTGATLGENFTVSAWYNLNVNPSPSGSSRYFVFESQTGFDISYGIRDNGQGIPGINDGQSFSEGANPASQNYADAATAGEWRHVAQTYQASGTSVTITTYIDGAARGTLTNSLANISDSGINFGAPRSSVTNRGFDGLMDEIAIWDEVLSPGQIARVYTFGAQGQTIPDVILEPVVGDADGNGVVDELDFFLISDNLSNNVLIGTNGDVDFDGVVTFADFRLWKGVASPAALMAAGFAVPEPGTVALLAGIVGLCAAGSLGRRWAK